MQTISSEKLFGMKILPPSLSKDVDCILTIPLTDFPLLSMTTVSLLKK